MYQKCTVALPYNKYASCIPFVLHSTEIVIMQLVQNFTCHTELPRGPRVPGLVIVILLIDNNHYCELLLSSVLHFHITTPIHCFLHICFQNKI